jgi:hypothetical protein
MKVPARAREAWPIKMPQARARDSSLCHPAFLLTKKFCLIIYYIKYKITTF